MEGSVDAIESGKECAVSEATPVADVPPTVAHMVIVTASNVFARLDGLVNVVMKEICVVTIVRSTALVTESVYMRSVSAS